MLKEQILIITKTILELDKPFSVSYLFFKMKKKGITNRALILEVLDSMCENGLITYGEFIDDRWAYCVTTKMDNQISLFSLTQ